jgi:chemotaxis protein histidine kinase CheA
MKRSAKDTTIVAQVNAETAANVVYEDQLDFDKAIKYFSETEEKCDLLIQRQDDLIRHVSRRMHGSADKTGDADMLVQLSPNPGVRTSLNATDLPFSEYRKIAALAVDRVGKQMPMATMRFIAQAGNSEVDIIEDLEAEIMELRRMMRNIEEVIIEQTPRSARDATTKLKFMTGLMLDGGEIEVDLFAYVVAECAEVIEIDLQRLRK